MIIIEVDVTIEVRREDERILCDIQYILGQFLKAMNLFPSDMKEFEGIIISISRLPFLGILLMNSLEAICYLFFIASFI